jgi:hypothetical protein
MGLRPFRPSVPCGRRQRGYQENFALRQGPLTDKDKLRHLDPPGSPGVPDQVTSLEPGECNRADVQLARQRKAVEPGRPRVALPTGSGEAHSRAARDLGRELMKPPPLPVSAADRTQRSIIATSQSDPNRTCSLKQGSHTTHHMVCWAGGITTLPTRNSKRHAFGPCARWILQAPFGSARSVRRHATA